jgi:hypothetical protein
MVGDRADESAVARAAGVIRVQTCNGVKEVRVPAPPPAEGELDELVRGLLRFASAGSLTREDRAKVVECLQVLLRCQGEPASTPTVESPVQGGRS